MDIHKVEPDNQVDITIEVDILKVDNLEEDNLIKADNLVEAFKVGSLKEDIIMEDILMEAFKVGSLKEDSLIEADSLKEASVVDNHTIIRVVSFIIKVEVLIIKLQLKQAILIVLAIIITIKIHHQG